MIRDTVIFIVLPGLCLFPSCFPQVHIIRDAKTWSEAQSYCRKKYADLLTIKNEEELGKLKDMLRQNNDEVWTGLHLYNKYRWSMELEEFHEADYKAWGSGEPNVVEAINCVDLNILGKWADFWCYGSRPFFCYTESPETRIIFVNNSVTWAEAQKYCREHYKDLVTVRNETVNQQLTKFLTDFGWIGLHRGSWKWSDGQPVNEALFSKEWQQFYSVDIKYFCVTLTGNILHARSCTDRHAFVCGGPEVRKKQNHVKLTMTKPDSAVQLEEMQDALLQQFQQRLEEHGLGDVELKWITQPDGKIFHLQETKDTSNDCD